jgi:replicative DNA helicase
MSTDIERPLPNSLEAERMVLGATMQDEKAFDALLQLKAEDFFLPQNLRIYEAVRDLNERHQPIDMFTVGEELRMNAKLDEAGGIGYVSSLTDGIPKITNVEFYAKLVGEKALLRRVIHTANAIMQSAFESQASTDGLLDMAVQSMIDLAITGAGQDNLGKTFRDAAVDCVRNLQEQAVRPVLTGISELDAGTGGFLPGELIIVTAGTGVGKTLFAQQTRRKACSDGLHTLYCSVEMTPEHLVSRELATNASVEHWKMRRPNQITDREYSALVEAAAHECERCRIVDGELSLQKIRTTARRLKRQGGLDFLVMDYDELIDAPGKTELDQQRALVRGAKNIAMEVKVPVMLISQLRKPLEPKEKTKPTLERIYGSGSKSKHASFVIYVDREYVRDFAPGTETKAEIYTLKSRDTKVGVVEARFNLSTLQFDNCAPSGSKEQK